MQSIDKIVINGFADFFQHVNPLFVATYLVLTWLIVTWLKADNVMQGQQTRMRKRYIVLIVAILYGIAYYIFQGIFTKHEIFKMFVSILFTIFINEMFGISDFFDRIFKITHKKK